jgi:hypothetical protein
LFLPFTLGRSESASGANGRQKQCSTSPLLRCWCVAGGG